MSRLTRMRHHRRIRAIGVPMQLDLRPGFAWSGRIVALCFALLVATHVGSASAQYIGLRAPFNNATESSYERMGVGFNFWLKGAPNQRGVVGLMPNGQLTPDGSVRFTQGSFGSAVPPFGGYDPNADANLGFRVNGSGGGFSLNLALGQGSSRTMTSTTPSIVVPNGIPGSVFSGQQTPFVTGIVPVVGGFPSSYYTRPLRGTYSCSPVAYKLWQIQQYGLNQDDDDELSLVSKDPDSLPIRAMSNSDSSANQASLSVRELKQQRQSRLDREERERLAKIQALIRSSDQAVRDRYYGAAREDLRKALRLANENERDELQNKLDAVPRR